MSRYVLVTGGAGGIGEAILHQLGKEGYTVLSLDKEPHQGGAAQIIADLARFTQDPDYRGAVLEEIRGHLPTGELHGLVNNAAVQRLGPLDQISDEEWGETLNVNLSAPFMLVRELLPELESAGGAVVNIASIHATQTKSSFVAYASSKAGLVGLTRALAVDLGGRVRVNAICPAAVSTEMLREGLQANDGLDQLASSHPARRIGSPAEIARLVEFLLRSGMPFLTGAVVGIDGGIAGRLHESD